MLSRALSPAAVPPVMTAALRRNSRRPMTCASSFSARSLRRLSITSPFWMRTASRHRRPGGSRAAYVCDRTRAARGEASCEASALRFDLALVPAAEGEAGEAGEERKDEHAGRRDQEHRGEHPGDLELVAGFEDAEGEPRLRAARARHELGHDGADEGEASADAQASEEIGEGGGEAEIPERLPARGAIETEEIDEVPVRAGESEHGVREHGKECDEPGADEEGERYPFDPQDDEGCDGYQRSDLKDNRVGEEGALYPRGLGEEDGEGQPEHGRDEEGRRGNGERDEERRKQRAPVRDHRARDQEGAGQDIRWNALPADHAFPGAEGDEAHESRREDAVPRSHRARGRFPPPPEGERARVRGRSIAAA